MPFEALSKLSQVPCSRDTKSQPSSSERRWFRTRGGTLRFPVHCLNRSGTLSSSHPLVPRGGEASRKPLSQRNLVVNAIVYINTIKTITFMQKKIVSIWRPNYLSLRVALILTKIWKTTFPKEYVNEICLIIEDYYYIYIYITEKKTGNFYSYCILRAK